MPRLLGAGPALHGGVVNKPTLERLTSAVRHFPWQRLVVCLIGCYGVWFFLQTHRNWVWAYFDSMMLMGKASPELASVASQGISAITTVTIAAMTAISAVVLFFITGDTAALSAMFKFSGATQAIGSVTSEVASQFTESTERIFNCEKLDPKDLDDEAFAQ